MIATVDLPDAFFAVARSWLVECAECGAWPGIEPEDVYALSYSELKYAVNNHYSGGLEAFIHDLVPENAL